MSEAQNGATDETVLEVRTTHRVLIVVVLALLGIGLGIAAPFVIGWAHGVDWLPFQGQLRLLEALSSKVGAWLLVVIGGIAGFVIGLAISDELTSVKITGSDITFVKGKKKQRFSRAQVTRALVDDDHLVLRDDRDADLIRHKPDVSMDDLRTALSAHGWPIDD